MSKTDSLTQSTKSDTGLREGSKVLTSKVYEVRTQDACQIRECYKENLAFADTVSKINPLQSATSISTLV